MKKITTLLISCSLALTGAALAQQPEEESSPKPNSAEKHKGHAPEGKPAAHEAKPESAVPEIPAEKKAPHAPKAEKHAAMTAPEASATETPVVPPAKHHANAKAVKTLATPNPDTATTNAVDGSTLPATTPPPAAKKHAKGKGELKAADAEKTSPAATAAVPTNEAASQPKPQAAAVKKPDPQKVKEIKAEHANFHAQPKPEQVPAVTFNESRRIEGSDQWQGRQYEVFRSYHAERHDEHYYRSHYSRVELIGGGYYYQHEGYWYPAWGYKPSAEYYAYDGPIYVGHRTEPPDRVIADVQAVLHHMDYYKGEVDGLLGPLTRQALTGYQTDQGLAPTAAIDEPTLDALGMN